MANSIGERLVRSAAYTAIRRRDGFAGWQAHRHRFRELATYGKEQLEDFVSRELGRLLTHAYETVPYYREAWSRCGFVPARRKTLADLRELPILTKDTIRARKDDLASVRYDRRALDVDFTGGTVGNQTAFYRDRASGTAKLGRQWGVLERCGYRPGDRRGLVWGAHRDLNPVGLRGLKWRVRDFAEGQEVLCCTTLAAADLEEYYHRLARFRPTVLYGYPSALEALAGFIVENRLQPLCAQRVICTAELLTRTSRRLFTDVFGGEVFNLYCSREHGCIGFECSRHAGLHLDVGSVIVEILCDGRPARPGERGEIVTTDVLNYGMPFVRYATGDLATVADSDCGCGLTLPRIESLDGRVVDALVRLDGRSVSGLMIADLYDDVSAIRAVQFVQDAPGVVDVNIVLTGDMTTELRDRIAAGVRGLMGHEFAVNVHLVSEIPRSPHSGKYREVVCRLDPHAVFPQEQGHRAV